MYFFSQQWRFIQHHHRCLLNLIIFYDAIICEMKTCVLSINSIATRQIMRREWKSISFYWGGRKRKDASQTCVDVLLCVTTLTSHVKIISITFRFYIRILVRCLSRWTCRMLTRRDLRIEIGLVCPTWRTMWTTFTHDLVPGTIRILQCDTVTVEEIKM